MDPEAIYAEVLAEEQQKGSASAVAEGRAKAARQRAHEGSPHPKEAKWWPGAQPQFEGGDAAPAAEAEAAPAEEAPVEETAPAEAAPAAETAPAAEAPTPEPAPESAPPASASASATEPAPAVVAEAAPPASADASATDRPKGVSHGVPTGNRLRPEDSVGSEAQFAGQQAMYDRRKLIDDLVVGGP